MYRISALFIFFTCLYLSTLFYLESRISHDQQHIYDSHHLIQVTSNNNYSRRLCHDPVRFKYPFYHIKLNGLRAPLHKNMIELHGFKNKSCPDAKIWTSEIFGINRTNTDICAKYDNNLLYPKKEFCNGGEIVWEPHERLMYDLSKSQVTKILSKYCSHHKMDNVCNFNLLTYNIDSLQQRIEFISKHLNCTNNNSQPNNSWVIKESKHQGAGIHIYDNHQLIYNLLRPNRMEEKKYYNKCINVSLLPMLQNTEYFEKNGFNYIKRNSFFESEYNIYKVNYNRLLMQQFISDPLLIHNRAFHIRTLHLIPSAANPLIVLQYSRYQIFRNPLRYNRSDVLTLRSNANVADMGSGGVKNKNGSIIVNEFRKAWGHNRFQKYLKETYNKPNLENKIQKDMQHIANVIFKARKDYPNKRSRNRNKTFDNVLRFDIACMDTVLNTKFELKFLEINFMGGFYCGKGNGTFLETVGDDIQFCNEFATETSNILMEIYEKQANGVDIQNINSLNKFKMVYIGE